MRFSDRGFYNPKPYVSRLEAPPPPPDDDIIDQTQEVKPPTIEEEAWMRIKQADEKIEAAMGSFLGKVWKIIVGIMAILITISIGVAILAGIWKAIVS